MNIVAHLDLTFCSLNCTWPYEALNIIAQLNLTFCSFLCFWDFSKTSLPGERKHMSGSIV